YAAAEAEFAASCALAPRASTQFNWAVALFQLARYPECMRLLTSLLAGQDAATDENVRRKAEELATRTRAHVATLAITVSPDHAAVAGVDLIDDGKRRAAFLTPGEHELTLSAAGYRSRVIAFEARAGALQTIDVVLGA